MRSRLPELRKRFNVDHAPTIVRAIGPDAVRISLSGATSRFAYFGDEDRLIVVAGPPEDTDSAERALAYGLSYLTLAEKSRLALVVAVRASNSTVRRIPWLRADIQVFEYEIDEVAGVTDVAGVAIPKRDVVIAAIDDDFGRTPLELGDREPWVRELVTWANDHVELDAAHRSSYLAWHCRGHRVLRCERVGGGIRITAGVDQSTPPLPTVITTSALLDDADQTRLHAAVESAINRLRGPAAHADPEHQLQAVLRKNPKTLGLLAADLQREFPALRSPGRPGFVDLLGRDEAGVVHLVETKIGDDVMLVLQGLDYWIWGEAHRLDLAQRYSEGAETGLCLDFVFAPKDAGDKISEHTQRQLRHLAPDVRWRFYVVQHWDGRDVALRLFADRGAH